MFELRERAVDIWSVDLADHCSQISLYQCCLSDSEKDRAARFHFDSDREQFIITHGILRHLLGQYLNKNPADLSFKTGEQGKPYIDGLEFNLSHSHDAALIAVTQDLPVGIDIEFHRTEIEFLSLAERFFSTAEYQQITALEGEAQKQRFFDIWSAKEAFIKGTGKGLSYGLEKFSTTIEIDDAIHLVTDTVGEAKAWKMKKLTIKQGFSASIAVRSSHRLTYNLRALNRLRIFPQIHAVPQQYIEGVL